MLCGFHWCDPILETIPGGSPAPVTVAANRFDGLVNDS
jgi:hypothetical protein